MSRTLFRPFYFFPSVIPRFFNRHSCLPITMGPLSHRFDLQGHNSVGGMIMEWNDNDKLSFEEIIARLEERGL